MQVTDILERQVLDLYLTSQAESNFLQAWEWGEFQLAMGKSVVRRSVEDHQGVRGVYTAVVEEARRGTIMTIAGGPLLDWADGQVVSAAFADIRQMAANNGADFVRVRPQLEDSAQARKLFADLGYSAAPMPLSVEHAGVIDLAQSEEEVMAGMSQSLRRKIRKAQKADIQIEVSDDPSTLDTFYDIHHDHAIRQRYVPFSKKVSDRTV